MSQNIALNRHERRTANRAAGSFVSRTRRPVAVVSGASMAMTVASIIAPAMAHASTFTVTNNGNAGSGSLRDALASAGDGDVVTFAASVTGTIALESPLQVSHAVTIDGPGAGVLTVDGQNKVQDLIVDNTNDGTVAVDGLTFTNGKSANGGGIVVETNGALTLSRSRVTNSNAGGMGGGIFVHGGTLNLVKSTVSGNSASIGGGIAATLPGQTALTITRSTISGNTASSGQGGGIYAAGVSRSGGGGDVTVYSCPQGGTLHDGNECRYYFGGEFNPSIGYCPRAAVPIDGCYFDAPAYSQTYYSPAASTAPGVVTVSTSTVAKNTAPSGDAAVFFSDLTTASVIGSSTIASNTGTGLTNVPGNGGLPSQAATIIAGNTADCSGTPITDGGFNIDSDGTCGLTGATGSQSHSGGIVGALGPLHDNGGPTNTMALALTSDPAHAVVPAAFTVPGFNPVCSSPDQRGVMAEGVPCDVGAFQIEKAPRINASVKYHNHHSTAIVTFHCHSASPRIAVTCTDPVTVTGKGSHTVTGKVVAEDGQTASVSKTVELNGPSSAHIRMAVTTIDHRANRVTRNASYRIS